MTPVYSETDSRSSFPLRLFDFDSINISLILLISSCGLVPVKPDNDVLKQLDPELAKNLLKSKCPTCTDSKINLSCEDGYFVEDDFLWFVEKK